MVIGNLWYWCWQQEQQYISTKQQERLSTKMCGPNGNGRPLCDDHNRSRHYKQKQQRQQHQQQPKQKQKQKGRKQQERYKQNCWQWQDSQKKKRELRRADLMINSGRFRSLKVISLLLASYIILAEFTFGSIQQASPMVLLASSRRSGGDSMIDGAGGSSSSGRSEGHNGSNAGIGGDDDDQEELSKTMTRGKVVGDELNLNQPSSGVWFAPNDHDDRATERALASVAFKGSGPKEHVSYTRGDTDIGADSPGSVRGGIGKLASNLAAPIVHDTTSNSNGGSQEFGGQAEQSAIDHQFISVLNNQSNIVLSGNNSPSNFELNDGGLSFTGRQHYVAAADSFAPFSATTFLQTAATIKTPTTNDNRTPKATKTLSSVLKIIEPVDKTIKSNGSSDGIQVAPSTIRLASYGDYGDTIDLLASSSNSTTAVTPTKVDTNHRDSNLMVGEHWPEAATRTNEVVHADLVSDKEFTRSQIGENESNQSSRGGRREQQENEEDSIRKCFKSHLKSYYSNVHNGGGIGAKSNSSSVESTSSASLAAMPGTKMIAYSASGSTAEAATAKTTMTTTNTNGNNKKSDKQPLSTAAVAKERAVESQVVAPQLPTLLPVIPISIKSLSQRQPQWQQQQQQNVASRPTLAFAATTGTFASKVKPPIYFPTQSRDSSGANQQKHHFTKDPNSFQSLLASNAAVANTGPEPEVLPVSHTSLMSSIGAFDLVPQTSLVSAAATRVPFEARKSKQGTTTTWRSRDGQPSNNEFRSSPASSSLSNEFAESITVSLRQQPDHQQLQQHSSVLTETAASQVVSTTAAASSTFNAAATNNAEKVVPASLQQQQQQPTTVAPDLNGAGEGEDDNELDEQQQPKRPIELFSGNAHNDSNNNNDAGARQQDDSLGGLRKPTRLDAKPTASSESNIVKQHLQLQQLGRAKKLEGTDEHELLVGPFKSELEAPATITLAGVVYQKSGSSSPIISRGALRMSADRQVPVRVLAEAGNGTTGSQTQLQQLAAATIAKAKSAAEPISASPGDTPTTTTTTTTTKGVQQQQHQQHLHWPAHLNSGPVEIVNGLQETSTTTAGALDLQKDSVGSLLGAPAPWRQQHQYPVSSVGLSNIGIGSGGLRLNSFPLVQHQQSSQKALQQQRLQLQLASAAAQLPAHEQLLLSSASSNPLAKSNGNSKVQSAADMLELALGSASNLVQEQPQQVAPAVWTAVKKGEHYYLSATGDYQTSGSASHANKAGGPIVIVQKDVKPVKYHLLRAYLKLRRLLRPFEATYVFANDPSGLPRRRHLQQQQNYQATTADNRTLKSFRDGIGTRATTIDRCLLDADSSSSNNNNRGARVSKCSPVICDRCLQLHKPSNANFKQRRRRR